MTIVFGMLGRTFITKYFKFIGVNEEFQVDAEKIVLLSMFQAFKRLIFKVLGNYTPLLHLILDQSCIDS